MVSRQSPRGADTEVRPPATLCLDPCGRVSLVDRPAGCCWPIQDSWLPIGSGICGREFSGADTEVRAPVTRLLGPDHGGLGWSDDWDGLPTSSPSTARTLFVPHPRETAANTVPNPSTRLGDLLGVRGRVLHGDARGGFSRLGRLSHPRRLGCIVWLNKAGASRGWSGNRGGTPPGEPPVPQWFSRRMFGAL